MKKTAIIGLAVLLSACASETYITDVSSETYKEDFKPDVVEKPIMESENAVVEVDVNSTDTVRVEAEPVEVSQTELIQTEVIQAEAKPVDAKPTIIKTPVKPEDKKVVKLAPQEQVKPVKTISASDKQPSVQLFGYTIQVAAVGNQSKVTEITNKLPKNKQPIWEHYKVVNETKWYSVLYGDYATSAEAQRAISTLPTQFQKLKPFVKSIDSIKNSPYPTLNKLN